jgi:hypothetical protein
MTTEPQSPLSETEKRAAFLAELEAERQRRIEAGKWRRGARPRLMAIPQAGETLQAAQQRALYGYLAEHPDALKTIAAYDWLQIEIIDPKPVIELPGELFEQPDTQDVSPPPYRPPVPPSPPLRSERSLPPPKGQPDARNYNIPATLPPPSAGAQRDSRVTTGVIRQITRCATRGAIATAGDRVCISLTRRSQRRLSQFVQKSACLSKKTQLTPGPSRGAIFTATSQISF